MTSTPRDRTNRRTAILALLLQLLAIPAGAYPDIRIHWGAGPFTNPESTSAVGTIPPGTITVTASGLTGTIKGLDVRVQMYAGGSAVPDAWRFDPDGCAEHRVSVNQNVSASYPLLTNGHRQDISLFRYIELSPGGLTEGMIWSINAAAFDPIAADPNVTYTLAKFDVDHSGMLSGPSTAEQCGCLERPMCISLVGVSYLDGNNAELQWTVSQPALSWNDPGNSLHCGGQWCDLSPVPCPWGTDTLCVANQPTPAARASWGRVKASYR